MSRLRDAVRRRVDYVPGAHAPRPVRAGAAAAVAMGLLLVVAFGGWRPWPQGGELVRAHFQTADQLTPGRTPVRMSGIEVGAVDSVAAGPGGRGALVTLKVTDDRVDVRRDASAHIRLRTVLGGTRYVDLDPGSPSAPALGAATIPLRRTTSQVDIDDLTQPFAADVRRAQSAAIRGLRQGLASPASAGRTIEALGPALDTVGRGARALRGRRNGDLRRLVASAGRAADALSRDRSALERLVAGGARTLAATAIHRRSLGRAVELSPAALRSTESTMRVLRATLGHLDPLVAELRPGARRLDPAARALRPALHETDRLLRAARPILRDLPPALRSLAAAGRQGVPLMRGLEPTLARTTDQLLPWLEQRDDETHLRNFEAIGPFFSVISSAAGDFDARGWFLHFPLFPTTENVPVIACGPSLNPEENLRCNAVNEVLKKTFTGGKRR